VRVYEGGGEGERSEIRSMDIGSVIITSISLCLITGEVALTLTGDDVLTGLLSLTRILRTVRVATTRVL